MTTEQILQNHLANVSIEIAKVDTTVSSTEKMPVEQLTVHRKKRQDLQETANYIKYLLQEEMKKNAEKEEPKIITM